jgi:hypothetical protein
MTAPAPTSALSHADCLWLLGYLSKQDPAAFALALAALAGTLARAAWQSPAGG